MNVMRLHQLTIVLTYVQIRSVVTRVPVVMVIEHQPSPHVLVNMFYMQAKSIVYVYKGR